MATLELRYSLRSAIGALVSGLVLTVCLLAGWALVLVIASLLLADYGFSWPAALALISIANLGFVASLWFAAKHFLGQVGFDATRRALLRREEPGESAQPHTGR